MQISNGVKRKLVEIKILYFSSSPHFTLYPVAHFMLQPEKRKKHVVNDDDDEEDVSAVVLGNNDDTAARTSPASSEPDG